MNENIEVFEIIKAVNRLKESVGIIGEKVDSIRKTLPYVPSQYWTEEEACEYMGISMRTMAKLRSKHKIRYVQAGRKPMYRPIDLDLFLESCLKY